jgi:hypothetical protein
MKFTRPVKFLALLISVVLIPSILSVAVTTKNFTESYPAVVCPPNLSGLNSQISLASKKTPFQRLQNRTTKTSRVKVLRLGVKKDSLVFNSEGVTPVVWQSRTGSWAGGALCSAPESSQWFVGGTADISTRGRLIIVNSGLSQAIVEVETFTENGEQPLRTLKVSAKKYLVLSIDSLAPGDKRLTVHVRARSGRINAFMIDEQGKGLRKLGGDLLNSVSDPRKNLVIPAIPHRSSKKSKALPHYLRVLNPGAVDANITVEVLSTEGVFVPVGLNSRKASAGKVTDFKLNPNIKSQYFAVRISSTEPVVVGVKSRMVVGGRKDFVWSSATPDLIPLTIAITGLNPRVAFAGSDIKVSLDVTLTNGKTQQKNIKGSDFVTWKVPKNARSIKITKVGAATFAGGLVSSVNGYGYFPFASGSLLKKIEVPDSDIRVLNP